MAEWIDANWSTVLPIILSVFSSTYTFKVWKKQRKLEDGLARSKAAYDIILKKEFSYYESINIIYAKLIPGVQDISTSLLDEYHLSIMTLEDRQSILKEEIMTYFSSIIELKALLQSHDIYLPNDVSKACRDVIVVMQNNGDYFFSEAEKLWNMNENEIDRDKCQCLSDFVLLSYTVAQKTIKNRINRLAKIV